ncbi:hypothetical protein QN277_022102 [Acacia crassicarpa]|uniref:Uncharacterized protein n=1 Tax=Acacia crassicarpa TaxID=499986 RepID=A0AAE1JIE8_9FABA|nr:hypothetical protein QN277_022102 [Acacia crassicarpa]
MANLSRMLATLQNMWLEQALLVLSFRQNVDQEGSPGQALQEQSYRLCKCWIIQILLPLSITSFQQLTKTRFT